MKKNRFDISLVTGASSGIGRHLSIELSKTSSLVYLIARNKKELAVTAEMMTSPSEIVVADLSTQAGLTKVIELVNNQHIDLLVNNAGFGSGGYFHERRIEKEMSLINTNVSAVVELTHSYINQSISSERKGVVLNVGSVVSFFPRPSNTTYAASKAFIRSFTDSLNRKYKDYGILVSCLYPGLTFTNFFEDPDSLRKHTILGQEPEHVAKVAIKGLNKNKRVIIPGFKNKLIIFLGKYLYKYF